MGKRLKCVWRGRKHAVQKGEFKLSESGRTGQGSITLQTSEHAIRTLTTVAIS